MQCLSQKKIFKLFQIHTFADVFLKINFALPGNIFKRVTVSNYYMFTFCKSFKLFLGASFISCLKKFWTSIWHAQVLRNIDTIYVFRQSYVDQFYSASLFLVQPCTVNTSLGSLSFAVWNGLFRTCSRSENSPVCRVFFTVTSVFW